MHSQILLLAGDFPPLGGGISNYLFELVRSLPADRVQVMGLPTPGWKNFDESQPFAIHRLNVSSHWGPESPQFKLLAPFYLLKWMQTGNSDIILCGQAHHTLMITAWVISRITGKPFGVFAYGLDLLRPQNNFQKRLFNRLLSSAHRVFSISQQTAEIAHRLGVERESTTVVHPIVSHQELQISVPVDQIKQKYGLNGKKIILSVGRLVERKGFDTLILALPEIVRTIPDVHYLIVGEGQYEVDLKEIVSNYGLNDYVTFTGSVPHTEIANYFATCDVFAMVSREIPEKGDVEGFGIVYLEANFFGKPVVAGRSGGIPDAVLDGETGLLVDPYHPKQTAKTIIRLFNDPDLAHRLGKNGRKRVLEHFSGYRVANKLAEVLQELVE